MMLTDALCATQSPDIADIRAAADRLRPYALRTPLLESLLLNDRLGGRLLIKAEPLQRTGSFKFRGAFNRLSLIPTERRAGGVVAFSSGNHAQGVAAAARMLGMPAVIIMPEDAPAMKIANTRAYGGEVVLFNRVTDSREAIGARIAAERGATLVKPYDDAGVIAGQGTIGLEIAAACADQGITPDAVVVNVSGGGMAAGITIALAETLPTCRVITAEPAGFDDMARSLISGQHERNAQAAGSICDALMAATPGALTLPVLLDAKVQGVAADDDTVKRAIHTAWQDFKLVIEPGGAVGLAAILSGQVPITGRTLIAVASGGNIDADLFRDCLALPPL